MNVSLGESDLDTGLAEFSIEGLVELMPCLQEVVDAGDEDTKLELQRAITESHKQHLRLRLVEHMFILLGNPEEEFLSQANLKTVEGLAELAKEKDITMPQLALAWLLSHSQVPSVIAGVTKMEHLEDNVKAAQVTLTEEDLKGIDEMV